MKVNLNMSSGTERKLASHRLKPSAFLEHLVAKGKEFAWHYYLNVHQTHQRDVVLMKSICEHKLFGTLVSD